MFLGSKLTWCLGASTLAVAFGVPLLGFVPGGADEPEQPPTNPEAPNVPVVETVHPAPGGLARRTTQPGSAHSFESAELFAKVSGYLQVQHVDIGSKVKQGDLLAEVDVPELAKDVEAAEASWQQSLAEVTQAEAQVESATAEHLAAEAKIAQAEAEVQRAQTETALQDKQYDRFKELNGLKGIEDRLVDEKLSHLQAAKAGERAARSGVTAAKQQAAAVAANIALAKANLKVAQAKARVSQTQHERAQVMASYTKIVSPYDGVITVRNFHRGAYVRAPDQGGQTPLLTVDRTDQMRFLVQVPEREVPFVQAGDKATVVFDALPGKEFSGKLARISHTQTSETRTMLAEIDLPNADHAIRDHMFGRVDIELERAPRGVNVPSACVVGDSTGGSTQMYVVSGGRARLRKVKVGKDSGIVVEVLEGLTPEDEVVVRPPGGLVEGAEVATAQSAASAKVTSADRQPAR